MDQDTSQRAGAVPLPNSARKALARRSRAPSAFRSAMLGLAVVGLGLLMLPIVALVWRSTAAWGGLAAPHTRHALTDALTLSLATSMTSLAVVVGIGTPIAYQLARRRSRMARMADAVVDLPIILPPAVAGVALLAAFGRNGLLGGTLEALGITVSFSTTAVVIAQVFVSAPFYIRSARAGFADVDRTIEEAAAVDGAAPHQVLAHVTLPLARGSLLAGAILSWGRALGEFGATIMFAGNRQGVTQTMPLAIYERFGAGDLPGALAFSLILLGASVVFLVAVRLVGRPGQRAM